MTEYSDDQLQGQWEFKILRAYHDAFRDSRVLERVRSEEAQSGWVLVEKFDNSRLRFKRATGARRQEQTSKLDPYRTHYSISAHYGVSNWAIMATGVGLVVAAIAVLWAVLWIFLP